MTHIRSRVSTASQWTADNPVLMGGEVGYEKDTRKSKLGDGTTPWNGLDYTTAVVTVTKADVGLGNADNTSDLNKPISTATQAALNLKGTAASVALKAPIDSPTFTGDPKAPTPAPGDNDTSIATTAFVRIATKGIVIPVADAAARDALSPIYDGLMVYREDIDRFEARINAIWQNCRIGDSGWSDITLKSGFTVGGGQTPRKRILGLDDVRLKGRIAGTFPANSTIPITLAGAVPAPVEQIVKPISVVGASNSTRGIINVDGSITVTTGADALVGVYLDALSGYLVN